MEGPVGADVRSHRGFRKALGPLAGGCAQHQLALVRRRIQSGGQTERAALDRLSVAGHSAVELHPAHDQLDLSAPLLARELDLLAQQQPFPVDVDAIAATCQTSRAEAP